jgi:hypothetical protein
VASQRLLSDMCVSAHRTCHLALLVLMATGSARYVCDHGIPGMLEATVFKTSEACQHSIVTGAAWCIIVGCRSDAGTTWEPDYSNIMCMTVDSHLAAACACRCTCSTAACSCSAFSCRLVSGPQQALHSSSLPTSYVQLCRHAARRDIAGRKASAKSEAAYAVVSSRFAPGSRAV